MIYNFLRNLVFFFFSGRSEGEKADNLRLDCLLPVPAYRDILNCSFTLGLEMVLSAVYWASLVAQRLKRLPVMQETWVRSLGQGDPLEKELATHSSTPAWRIPWTEELSGSQSTGSQRVGHDWVTSLSFFHFLLSIRKKEKIFKHSWWMLEGQWQSRDPCFLHALSPLESGLNLVMH